jgi:hypothetical protein
MIFRQRAPPQNPDLIQLLADDTKTYQVIVSGEDYANLQARIDAIETWARIWKMILHPEKTKMLHVGPNNPRAEYFLAGNQIQTVSELKDIGYWLTKDLSSRTPILKARGRAI